MGSPIVECVPNFSEGRDKNVVDAIARSISDVAGVSLLGVDPGADTNRTVFTFIGGPEAVARAALAAAKTAFRLIDMSKHSGAHPRMGALDVCPFVPVSGIDMEDCVELAKRVGAAIASELGVPVYLYEAAASRPERKSLARHPRRRVRGPSRQARQERVGARLRPCRLRPALGRDSAVGAAEVPDRV